MARKIKVDNAVLKRLRRKEEKERIEFQAVRQFILVVCEGEKTEPNYFQSLKNTLPKNVLETVQIDIVGTGANTETVVDLAQEEVQKAKERRNREFDQVWIVIDRDSFPAQHFNNAIFRCEGLGYHCAWSNEAFELWYVLHFQYRNTAMGRQDYAGVIEQEIRSRIVQAESPSIREFTYAKNDPNMLAVLQEFGDEGGAIRNADKLVDLYDDQRYSTHNPCTQVHELVRALNVLRNDGSAEEE